MEDDWFAPLLEDRRFDYSEPGGRYSPREWMTPVFRGKVNYNDKEGARR